MIDTILSNVGNFLAGAQAMMMYWGLAILGTIFFGITCLLSLFGLGGIDNPDFDADGSGSAAYDAAAQEIHDANKETCRRAKGDMVDIRCNEDLVKPLMAFFRPRRGKMSAGRV